MEDTDQQQWAWSRAQWSQQTITFDKKLSPEGLQDLAGPHSPSWPKCSFHNSKFKKSLFNVSASLHPLSCSPNLSQAASKFCTPLSSHSTPRGNNGSHLCRLSCGKWSGGISMSARAWWLELTQHDTPRCNHPVTPGCPSAGRLQHHQGGPRGP